MIAERPLAVFEVGGRGLRLLDLLREEAELLGAAPAELRFVLRLADAGLVELRPVLAAWPAVSVVVPVRDRPADLAACLASLERLRYPRRRLEVVVVDDGSTAAVTVPDGVRLLRLGTGRGPAAARNAGARASRSEVLAFLDSDCVAEPGWLETLVPALAVPGVGAAGGRVLPAFERRWLERYEAVRSPLDLGSRPRAARPAEPVPYLVSANLVVRRPVFESVGGFDPALRWGEDVDLVWRLHAAGWRIRYDPAARVSHHEPDGWAALLARRFRYGTAAAPLASRHPGQVPPLVLHPWPALTVAGLLAGRPEVAGLSFTGSVLAMRRTVHRAGLPARGVVPAMLDGTRQTWLGIGRYACQFGAPVLAAALVAPGGKGPARRWARRAAAASLLLGPPLTAWSTRRRSLDPVRYVLGHLADDMAYGAGVWTGALRARTMAPVRPVIAWRPFRVSIPEVDRSP